MSEQNTYPTGAASLTAAERAWYKEHWGSEHKFLRSYNLGYHDDDQIREGRAIMRAVMEADDAPSANTPSGTQPANTGASTSQRAATSAAGGTNDAWQTPPSAPSATQHPRAFVQSGYAEAIGSSRGLHQQTQGPRDASSGGETKYTSGGGK